jgi:L-rhamnose isomerase
MKKEQSIQAAFDMAADRYTALGIDVNRQLDKLNSVSLSLHCWQADDVSGFENQGGELTGGIQVTGNYPGRARTIDELRADVKKAASYIAGHHRLSLHEIYGDFGGKKVDRNEAEPAHFTSWMQWAKENNMKLDFNSTSFSHPKSGDLTLSNPDDAIRNFWIEHTKRCRWISDEIGIAQNDPCMMNLWIHDGSKEVPANRLKYRRILEQSLDEIFATRYKHMKDCIEAKLFGIGLESYTVGSYDFYLGYGAKKGKIVTLDTGHFHLTESVADKISSLLLFTPEIMLHVSRPIRWDSDHVVILNDDLHDLTREIIRCNALDRVHIGLDYFDATINRIGAYVIGCRATQKALLEALLEPSHLLQQYEAEGKYFERLALQETSKSLPWSAVWDMYCLRNNIPVDEDCIPAIQQYEKEVTSKRG